MNIVHVIRQFHPAQGGLETVVDNLTKRQANRGHEVKVVTLDRVFGKPGDLWTADALGDVAIARIPYFGSQRYPIALSVLTKLQNADIVHVHAIDFFFDFLALTKLLHRKKLIVSTHGGFFHTGFASKLKKVYFALATRASICSYSFVAASSEHDRGMFSRIRKGGIDTVANGVDCEKFADAVRNLSARQLIYFGRFAPSKNLGAVFPFLKALREQDGDWRLVIAGRPMDVTIPQLYNAACAAGVGNSVTILESPSDDELRDAIASSSVFVSPSLYEGFGIAAIEAMSAGLLPVLSDIDAHRETVRNTGIGILADFANPEAAAEAALVAWREWLDQPPDRRAVAARLSVYSWDAVAERFEDIYARVIGHSERKILSARVRVSNADEAMLLIDAHVTRREPLRVAFVNAHLANEAARDRNVAAALVGFHLLNDGVGVDLASLLLYGRQFPENLNGTDFTPSYLDRTRLKLRLFLLGANARVVGDVAEHFAKRWPQHNVVGFSHGYFGADEAADLAARVRAARPDIVLAAMGNPRQELWLSQFIPDVAPVGIAVGALFDFQTGSVRRAPALVRKLRMEWAYRLAAEPRRLGKRYTFGNAMFLSRVALQFARGERA